MTNSVDAQKWMIALTIAVTHILLGALQKTVPVVLRCARGFVPCLWFLRRARGFSKPRTRQTHAVLRNR